MFSFWTRCSWNTIIGEPLRRANNHTIKAADGWQKLARDVVQYYGHTYQRAVDYLSGLASNSFWRDSELVPLPWHQQNQPARLNAEPRYLMHHAVMNALAPSVPLRAVFSRGPERNWCPSINYVVWGWYLSFINRTKPFKKTSQHLWNQVVFFFAHNPGPDSEWIQATCFTVVYGPLTARS